MNKKSKAPEKNGTSKNLRKKMSSLFRVFYREI